MKIAAVLMAAGASSRFGECKLIKKFASRPMFEYALDALPYNKLCAVAVVSGRAEILAAAKARGFIPVLNDRPEDGPPRTIRLGMEAVGDADGIMFMVADQPLLRRESVAGELDFFAKNASSIVAMGHGARRGNPVIFPREFFDELKALRGERGGGAVMTAHRERIMLYQLENGAELMDIDTASDYIMLQKENGR